MVQVGGLEILQSGGDDRPPRNRLLTGTVAAVIAALTVGLGWLDVRDRHAEVAVILRCVDAGERALADADAGISMMSRYVAPALASSPAPDVKEGLRELVRDAAAKQVPAVAGAVGACADVPVRSWHGGVARARDSYRRYLSARLHVLEATVADERELFVRHPEIREHREDARDALLAAAPRSKDVDAVLPES